MFWFLLPKLMQHVRLHSEHQFRNDTSFINKNLLGSKKVIPTTPPNMGKIFLVHVMPHFDWRLFWARKLKVIFTVVDYRRHSNKLCLYFSQFVIWPLPEMCLNHWHCWSSCLTLEYLYVSLLCPWFHANCNCTCLYHWLRSITAHYYTLIFFCVII